jgi:hypothetical protein
VLARRRKGKAKGKGKAKAQGKAKGEGKGDTEAAGKMDAASGAGVWQVRQVRLVFTRSTEYPSSHVA